MLVLIYHSISELFFVKIQDNVTTISILFEVQQLFTKLETNFLINISIKIKIILTFIRIFTILHQVLSFGFRQ